MNFIGRNNNIVTDCSPTSISIEQTAIS